MIIEAPKALPYCVHLFHRVFNSSDYVQTVFMPLYSLLVDEKNELYHSLVLKVIML